MELYQYFHSIKEQDKQKLTIWRNMQHWAWTQKENKDIKAKRNLTQKNNMSNTDTIKKPGLKQVARQGKYLLLVISRFTHIV
jgi:hypothetical protein